MAQQRKLNGSQLISLLIGQRNGSLKAGWRKASVASAAVAKMK